MPGVKNWKSSRAIIPTRMGFVSTRFQGTDGVSLESIKWAEVLAQDEHQCFWYAGRLDHPANVSFCVPEAFFGHPENTWINQRIWGRTSRDPIVTKRIKVYADYLKSTLYEFTRRFEIKVLILENILSIPMHVPLGIAAAEFIAETHIPAIAHHHDFYWERSRYSVNAVHDFLDMAFPTRNQDLQHVTINQAAQEELARRKAVPSILIPNALDFDTPPPQPDEYSSDIRADIGLAPDDVMILQPTRVVPRKGIEHAINLVKQLNHPKYKLVITHEAGDEGLAYRSMLAEYARQSNVDLRFFETRIGDMRQISHDGRKIYTLWDIYPYAALVTYPSLYEGFGNAFLEAIYFHVPLLVNRYAIFHRDIEPKGFQVAVMDGFITPDVIAEVKRLLEDEHYRKQACQHNYRLAARHYSYAELRRRLRTLAANLGSLYAT